MSKSAAGRVGWVLLGGILGCYVGELMGLLIPNGFFHDLFVTGLPLGFDSPLVLDLKAIVLTFGFKIYLNLLGVAGAILAFTSTK